MNAPPSWAILSAMQVRWSNPDGIAQSGISGATPEATGHHHWATTHSLLPRRPPGWQQTKQRWKNWPTLLAILMAMAVRRYNTLHIPHWRKSRALLQPTGRHHWASIAADSCNQSCIGHFFEFFHYQLVENGCGLTLRTQLTIGVWHIKQKKRTQIICLNTLGGGGG